MEQMKKEWSQDNKKFIDALNSGDFAVQKLEDLRVSILKNKKEDLTIIIKFRLPIKKKHLSEEQALELLLKLVLLQLQAASKPRINATPFRPLSSNLSFFY